MDLDQLEEGLWDILMCPVADVHAKVARLLKEHMSERSPTRMKEKPAPKPPAKRKHRKVVSETEVSSESSRIEEEPHMNILTELPAPPAPKSNKKKQATLKAHELMIEILNRPLSDAGPVEEDAEALE